MLGRRWQSYDGPDVVSGKTFWNGLGKVMRLAVTWMIAEGIMSWMRLKVQKQEQLEEGHF